MYHRLKKENIFSKSANYNKQVTHLNLVIDHMIQLNSIKMYTERNIFTIILLNAEHWTGIPKRSSKTNLICFITDDRDIVFNGIRWKPLIDCFQYAFDYLDLE